MRRKQLLEHVSELVEKHFDGDDADIAEVLVHDEAFPALAATLNRIADDEECDVSDVFETTVAALSDATLDWIAGDTDDGSKAENPAAFLAAKAREVH